MAGCDGCHTGLPLEFHFGIAYFFPLSLKFSAK